MCGVSSVAGSSTSSIMYVLIGQDLLFDSSVKHFTLITNTITGAVLKSGTRAAVGGGCCSEETGRPTSRSAFVQVVGLLNTYRPLTVIVFVINVKWSTIYYYLPFIIYHHYCQIIYHYFLTPRISKEGEKWANSDAAV